MDPIEFARAIVYRRAYGLAHRVLKRERLGPNFPGRDDRDLLRRLVAEVEREMGADHGFAEAIAEGVADAVARRRPRW